MPSCPKCGASLVDDAQSCHACGVSLVDVTASFTPVGGEQDTAPAITDADGPVLVVRKGPQTGERFYIESRSLTLGRDPESDIFLNDMTVSRSHARLEVGDDGAVGVSDAGSLNGTYVNGRCVDSARLVDGDVLQIGTFQMVFIEGGGAAR